MLKYVDTLVSFQEIPDEISLCINISNCPCHCEGCHSSYLAEDIGRILTIGPLFNLIEDNKGISCVSFMGGDSDPERINGLAWAIKKKYPTIDSTIVHNAISNNCKPNTVPIDIFLQPSAFNMPMSCILSLIIL